MQYTEFINDTIEESSDVELLNFYYFKNGFSKEECELIRKSVEDRFLFIAGGRNKEVTDVSREEAGKELGFIYVRMGNYINEANRIWNFKLLGIREDLQYTIYKEGGMTPRLTDVQGAKDRKISFVIQLSDSDDYSGGEILGDIGNYINFPKKQGDVIFFPSYLVTEVLPLTRGERHAILGWVSGHPFC